MLYECPFFLPVLAFGNCLYPSCRPWASQMARNIFLWGLLLLVSVFSRFSPPFPSPLPAIGVRRAKIHFLVSDFFFPARPGVAPLFFSDSPRPRCFFFVESSFLLRASPRFGLNPPPPQASSVWPSPFRAVVRFFILGSFPVGAAQFATRCLKSSSAPHSVLL